MEPLIRGDVVPGSMFTRWHQSLVPRNPHHLSEPQPGKMGGHRRPVLSGETAEWIRSRLKEKQDLTMRALAAELAERGVVVTHDTVWRFVRCQGLSFK